jgi:phage shock protein PspC (stress-responsive transcriptional regulator)
METTSPPRHLRRSLDDRVAAGVCGGVAAYLGVDASWVRLAFVVAAVLFGIGLLVYALLWITLPEQGDEDNRPDHPPLALTNPGAVVGILLLTVGLFIVLWILLSAISFKIVAAALLVGLGLFLIMHQRG